MMSPEEVDGRNHGGKDAAPLGNRCRRPHKLLVASSVCSYILVAPTLIQWGCIRKSYLTVSWLGNTVCCKRDFADFVFFCL